MSDKTQRGHLLSSLRRLRSGGVGKHHTVPQTQLESHLKRLQEWQADRLARTHVDFLSSRQFGPACRFFLEEIYAARDFSQRDHDAEVAYQAMRRLLPSDMMETLGRVLRLNELTAELDRALSVMLVEQLDGRDEITETLYAEAYRMCDNYDERAGQIDLIIEVGQGVARLVKLPFVSLVLRMARAPARRFGWGELQRFLEDGFSSFKQINDADDFLHTIEWRERQILSRIYQGEACPFVIKADSASHPSISPAKSDLSINH